ncbi:terminase small subunit [Cupriavidus numazuensis]|uniref:terminase small subunit n=1 Tax=Cupriavidus numazuensis TaxID=221992 RepID=UPI001BABFCCB
MSPKKSAARVFAAPKGIAPSTQAAIRAGYKGDPNTVGPRLLVNVGIARAIQAAQQARSERTQITADKVLRRWWDLANVDVNELCGPLQKTTVQGPASISAVGRLPSSPRRT